MSQLRRWGLAPIGALAGGILAALGLFSLSEGRLGMEDAVGVSTLSFVAGVACVGLHAVALFRLERRVRLDSTVSRVLLAIGVINSPIYLLLYTANLRGGVFARGEAVLWAGVVAVIGAVFALLNRPLRGVALTSPSMSRLANGSRLSCGRNARGRAAASCGHRVSSGAQMQFYLTRRRPAASSPC